MKNFEKIICVLTACWMVVIFMFSAQPDTESSELSGGVSYRLISIVNTVTAQHWDEAEKLEKAQLIDYPVRKAAHMSEYAFLTLLGFGIFASRKDIKKYIFPIGITFLYACTDEFHQLFVPGRAGRFTDVLIDTSGGIIMMLFIILIIALKKHITLGKGKTDMGIL